MLCVTSETSSRQSTGGITMKTEEKTELKEKEAKLPYEKPELIELGSVEDMTSDIDGSMRAF